MNLKFKDLRNYVSRIDRISICLKDTLQYENYCCMKDVPDKYDEYYVYGIGMIDSEVIEDDKLVDIKPHLEIMICDKPSQLEGEHDDIDK